MNTILDLFDRVTITEAFAVQLEAATIRQCRMDMSENRIEIVLACTEASAQRRGFLILQIWRRTFIMSRRLTSAFICRTYSPEPEYFDGLIDAFLRKNGKLPTVSYKCDGECETRTPL